MKTKLIFSILILLGTLAHAQLSRADFETDIKEAEQTKALFLSKDPGLHGFFDKSYGYAILPTVGKGGLIVGGAHGKGILFREGEATGLADMTQVTLGGQIGGKAYSEIIFFKSKAEYDVFTTGRFEVAAQVSALALTEGVSNNLAYSDGVAIITMDKGGLMAEAVVGGQKFKFEPFDD